MKIKVEFLSGNIEGKITDLRFENEAGNTIIISDENAETDFGKGTITFNRPVVKLNGHYAVGKAKDLAEFMITNGFKLHDIDGYVTPEGNKEPIGVIKVSKLVIIGKYNYVIPDRQYAQAVIFDWEYCFYSMSEEKSVETEDSPDNSKQKKEKFPDIESITKNLNPGDKVAFVKDGKIKNGTIIEVQVINTITEDNEYVVDCDFIIKSNGETFICSSNEII